ncbi:MAG TPA: hypothetical protein VLM38_18575 [Blastocatellia bacterium]|nr:hypothetical protein [Blastocatellia bacterium]
MEVTIAEDRLKEVLKTAVIEVLEERADLLREIVEEALEDIALARAIEEGESSELVGRDHVFGLLEGEA